MTQQQFIADNNQQIIKRLLRKNKITGCKVTYDTKGQLFVYWNPRRHIDLTEFMCILNNHLNPKHKVIFVHKERYNKPGALSNYKRQTIHTQSVSKNDCIIQILKAIKPKHFTQLAAILNPTHNDIRKMADIVGIKVYKS